MTLNMHLPLPIVILSLLPVSTLAPLNGRFTGSKATG